MQMQLCCLPVRSHIPPCVATIGPEGIEKANEVLIKYGSVGMLIGGVAWSIWMGNFMNTRKLKVHKDLDVLVLSGDCRKHPLQQEGGIDWWVSHRINERPSNGLSLRLYWNARLLENQFLSPGLYLCPKELIIKCCKHEDSQQPEKPICRSWNYKSIENSKIDIRPIPMRKIHLELLSEVSDYAYYCNK